MPVGAFSDAVRAGNGGPIYGPFTTVETAAGAEVVNRSSVAALAFLVWDILITFDDEVRYMWPRKWTYTKYAYFVARYLPLMVETSILLIGTELTPLFHFSSHDCFIWQVFQGVSAATTITTVDSILILRVFALYHENCPVRIAIIVFFGIEVIGMVVGLTLALPGAMYDDVCLVIYMPKTLTIYGASSITFQMFLFTLTMYKFLTALRTDWNNVPLIKLLIRDGTWAFILLFVIYVGQVALYSLAPHAYVGALYGWLLTTFSFCGCRMLLNLSSLSELAYPPQGVVPTSRHTGTNIDFTTQILDYHPNTCSIPTMDQLGDLESFELSPPLHSHINSRLYPSRRQVFRHHQGSRNHTRNITRTAETSEISTLSLEH